MIEVPDWAAYCRWRDAFAEVIDPRMYSLEWLDGRILDGSAQLWATSTAAIITELRHYPTGATDLHYLVVAGELGEVLNTLRPAIEDWAKRIGCIGAVGESREGWAKVLKPHGYRLYQIGVRKDF